MAGAVVDLDLRDNLDRLAGDDGASSATATTSTPMS
jgi:hypothetical protein